jgi:ribonuclease P protein component
MKFTFQKAEKLSREKLIKELFNGGSSFYSYPFKVVFLANPDQDVAFHQILLSVSNRIFKKAVDRNTVKRRMREAYRLHKHLLVSDKKLLIAYIYTAKEILPSAIIHGKLPLTFPKLKEKEHETKN